MANRKGVLRWIKAALILGGLPLTMSTIGTSLTGIWVPVGNRYVYVFDVDEFKRESSKVKKKDVEEFFAGFKAIRDGGEQSKRAVKAFSRLLKRTRFANSICVINNLTIAYCLRGDWKKAEKKLRKLKKLRDNSRSIETRERLQRNCQELGFLIQT